MHRHAPLSRMILTVAALLLLLGAGVGTARLIPCLSGFVRDPDGVPVDDADLDFNVSATGQRILTPGDNTDASGFYTVCVLPNVYDVSFAPPPGTRLMGLLMRGVDLGGDVGAELDVTLQRGNVVSGMVRASGVPVGDVDVDVDDVAGGRVYTPDDNSDLVTGLYRVVVPAGTHRFRFEPPPGSRLLGAEIDSVDTTVDAVLDVDLVEGLLITGRVTGDGAAAFDVDVDLRDRITGEKIFLANNATDLLGDYAVAVPAGTFQLRYAPPRGSRLVASLEDSVVIAADLDRDVALTAGALVGLTVRDPDGVLVKGADLDVKDRATGVKVFTPHDRTDILGRAEAALLPGVYDLEIDPIVGSNLGRVFVDSLVVTGDVELTIDLPAAERVLVTGRVVDAGGAPVGGTVVDAADASGADIDVVDDATAADGTFAVLLPVGVLELTFAPPPGSNLQGLVRGDVELTVATDLGDVVLADGHVLSLDVSTEEGGPVPGADVDVFALPAGDQVFTPYDDADASGIARVVLAAGSYRIVVTPPPGSGLTPAVLDPVVVSGDAVIDVVLEARIGGDGPLAIALASPNPFRDEVDVTCTLPDESAVMLEVYDLRGRRLAILDPGVPVAGNAVYTWDGRRDDGAAAASGTYVMKLSGPSGADSKLVTIVR